MSAMKKFTQDVSFMLSQNGDLTKLVFVVSDLLIKLSEQERVFNDPLTNPREREEARQLICFFCQHTTIRCIFDALRYDRLKAKGGVVDGTTFLSAFEQ